MGLVAPNLQKLGLFPSAHAIAMGDKEYHGAVNIGATMKARYNAWQHRVSAGIAAGLHGSGVHGIGKRFRGWLFGPTGQGVPVRVTRMLVNFVCVPRLRACPERSWCSCATALIVPWRVGHFNMK